MSKVTTTEWLQKSVEEFGNDAMIQKLNLPKIKARIEAAGTAMTTFADSVSDWEFPLAFEVERKVGQVVYRVHHG